MSKPLWEDAPNDAYWLAQDPTGSWWWYEHEPILENDGWSVASWHQCECCGAANISPAGRSQAIPEWSSTLEKRP